MRSKEKYLIIGFNSRPIAISAKKAGYQVAVIDFFGDQDLKIAVDDVFSVLWQRPGHPLMRQLVRPAQEYLMSLADIMLEEQEIVGILQGSGLDDYFEDWIRIAKQSPIVGNPPERLRSLRDRNLLYNLAQKCGFKTPKMEHARSPEEAGEIAQQFGFPVVLRPAGGSAGIDAHKCEDEEKVKTIATHILKTRDQLLVLEFIDGTPASASLVGTGDVCRIVAINEQLIGFKEFGAPSEFFYTGNISPLALQMKPEQITSLEQLGAKMKLIGSNGVDFIIRGDEICIIELNPRFQGSLECIESAYDINLVEMHLKACQGVLPEISPNPQRSSGKAVIYAKTSRIMKTLPPQLKNSQVVDRSLPGVIMTFGDPVCTLLTTGKSREQVISKLLTDSKLLDEAY
jgi:predicted ATP-grasp superfamily ATP-dependent carboligase